jgi:hypothetical protein
MPPARRDVALVVSIDTEEDNWVPARENIRVENARQLPRLNEFLTRLGARPTYFVAHSIAANAGSAAIIREIHDSKTAEIGAHLHPWNTPPLEAEFVPRHSMLRNLPAAEQAAKLSHLTGVLTGVLGGAAPTSFRAGRWAIGSETIGVLLDCGYTVDSSVTPNTSWAHFDDGPSHIGAPVRAYRLARGADVRQPVAGGPLIEVPPSFGFNRAPLDLWSRVHRGITSRMGARLLLDRIAGASGVLRHVTLSPETDTVDDMMRLTRALLAAGVEHLHMYLHSPTLTPGLTPFVRDSAQRDRFYASIEEYFHRVTELVTPRFMTVREAAAALQPA